MLTGGSSRRLGRDKATTHVGGRRLIDRLLEGVPTDVPVVVVGGHVERLPRPVLFVREEPAGSGPLAAIGAGVANVRTARVGVIAADMPFALPVVVEALSRLLVSTGEAVLPIDAQGYLQPLSAAYRTDALGAALDRLGPAAGRPIRALLPLLDVVEWSVPAADLADVDTSEQLAVARIRVAEEDWAMQEWVDAVREALGVDVALDVDVVLDVARDAAHGVDRPAAPVTTYLLGAAVAGGADAAEAAATIAALARGWAAREQ